MVILRSVFFTSVQKRVNILLIGLTLLFLESLVCKVDPTWYLGTWILGMFPLFPYWYSVSLGLDNANNVAYAEHLSFWEFTFGMPMWPASNYNLGFIVSTELPGQNHGTYVATFSLWGKSVLSVTLLGGREHKEACTVMLHIMFQSTMGCVYYGVPIRL